MSYTSVILGSLMVGSNGHPDRPCMGEELQNAARAIRAATWSGSHQVRFGLQFAMNREHS